MKHRVLVKAKIFLFALFTTFITQGAQAQEIDRGMCAGLGMALVAEATERNQELVAKMFWLEVVPIYMGLHEDMRLAVVGTAAGAGLKLGNTEGFYDLAMDLWLDCSLRYAE